MGLNGLPTIFIDDPAELPSAKKWNDNNDFLNFVHDNLVRNGDFEDFPGVVPESWGLTGAGATSVVDADSKRGTNAVKITFGSATAKLEQSASEFKFFKGRKVKAWVFVKTSFSSQSRIRISDGIGSSQSSFHTGGGAYELLEVTHTMAGSATELTLELEVATTGSALFDAAMLIDFDEARGFIPHAADEQISAEARVPAGAFMPFAGTAIPSGYLECNGLPVSRSTFSVLFGVLSTIWGSGDGSTTFNLPDLRGVFPRGHVDLADKTFAPADVNLTTEEITITAHGFNRSGVPVRFTTTGALPPPLTTGTDFFVIFVDSDKIKVATTRANAIAGTAIDLTGQGTGTHTIIQRLDPDASDRAAMAPGASTGDNVGTQQDDEFRSHFHAEATTFQVNKQDGADVNAAKGSSGFTGPAGGNETRPQNAGVKYIIKT